MLTPAADCAYLASASYPRTPRVPRARGLRRPRRRREPPPVQQHSRAGRQREQRVLSGARWGRQAQRSVRTLPWPGAAQNREYNHPAGEWQTGRHRFHPVPVADHDADSGPVERAAESWCRLGARAWRARLGDWRYTPQPRVSGQRAANSRATRHGSLLGLYSPACCAGCVPRPCTYSARDCPTPGENQSCIQAGRLSLC